MRVPSAVAAAAALVLLCVDAAAVAAPSAPTQPGAPWPTMRHDPSGTGRSDVVGRYGGDRPWAFRTGRGIFSTPVIGRDDTVYIGSADGRFYALGPGGRPRWSLRTGGIIDAAAALGRDAVTIGSGDELLYSLRLDRGPLPRSRRVRWTLRAPDPPVEGQLVSWWEGNVAVGPDGGLFAGNTGGSAYAIAPDGRLRWRHRTGGAVWTTPAFADDGTSYWGSLDLGVFALDAGGRLRWRTGTAGFVVSSPAVGPDGTVYVASFDRRLLALDGATGAVRWAYTTGDHVYASPALSGDRVVIASTDGAVTAHDRATGALQWRYDTGDPVRSSPVIGPTPTGEVVYVGASDGRLYALDAATGRRRWSYDTTPRDPELRDRNDLNGSPALGRTGIVIGGEHGLVTYVPYDFCLRRRDARCDTRPTEPFAGTSTRLLAVTPGGTTRRDGFGTVPSTSALIVRLVARRGDAPLDARLARLRARVVGPGGRAVPARVQLSGDARVAFAVPDRPLAPGARHTLRLDGAWRGPDGRTTPIAARLPLRTGASRGRLPLRAGRDRVSALRLTRLAVPQPAFLPSVNQIGFDSYDWLVGTVARTGDHALVWVVGARLGRDGRPEVDPARPFSFPLAGRVQGDSVTLEQRDLTLRFSFGETPQRRFGLRAQLGADGRARPGASLYAEIPCRRVPVYGPALLAIGLCNGSGTLPLGGTFLTRGYDARGTANRRPRGVRLRALRLTRPTARRAGGVVARLAVARGARYPARAHLGSLLLADARTGRPLTGLDLRARTTQRADARGDLREIRLTLPRGRRLPARLRAYVMTDVFPLAQRDL